MKPALVFVSALAVATAAVAETLSVGSTAELFAVRDRLRTQKPTAPLTVRLQAGTYFLDRPFALTAADSGTPDAPIAYVGEKGKTFLTSAKRVPSERFVPWKDGIVVADIADLGVRFPTRQQIESVTIMPAPVPELFVDGERFATADWPNAGEWATFTNFVENGVGWDVKTPTNALGQAWSAGVFGYDGDRPARWTTAPYLWVHGYFKWDWRDNLVWIKAVDPNARTIALGGRATYGLGRGNPSPRRWRAIHVLAELDAPGEYYVDFFEKKLYLKPHRPLTAETCVEIVAGADTLVTFKDVKNVALRDLALVGANQALTGTGCRKVTLKNLFVTKIRGNAVTLENCAETRVETCDITAIGGRCLRLAGGDRKTLEPSGNSVIDCNLGPAGLVTKTGAAGFETTGVGTVFRHNFVHDMPHHAIGIGWVGANDCVFAENIISNCCNESDDASAFYKGRNPSACGNLIEGNVFVDCGRNGKHGTCAIYFDDGDCGDIVRGNVFERCGNPPRHPGASVWGAIFFNGGYAFTCEDNVFIDCYAGASTSAPEGWCTDAWWRGELDGRLGARLAEVNATGEVYTVKYPFLKTIYPPLPVTARTNFLSRCTFMNVLTPVNGRTHCRPDCRVLKADDGTRPAASRAAGLLTPRRGTVPAGQTAFAPKVACPNPGSWTVETKRTESANADLDEYVIRLSSPTSAVPPQVEVSFDVPQLDAHHKWTTQTERVTMPPNWSSSTTSRLCSSLPLVSFLNDNDRNRILVAASEAKRTVKIEAGLREEDCRLVFKLVFFTEPEAPVSDAEVRVRIDRRDTFFGTAIAEGVAWIEKTAKLTPAEVPEAAFEPLYSAWYSFHQDVFDREIEAECAEAAKLGMKVVIVDDGWQTDDTNRGYAYTGDWEVSRRRFPDMAAHVARVHALGLKYMVWYGVPMMGVKAKNYDRFKGKYLWTENGRWSGYSCLDPRFPEVRAYLCDLYEKAMRDWGLDGLKLDFIDAFGFHGPDPAVAENYAGRDIRALPEAVDRLMRDVHARVTAVRPDALIEFRQSYIGPAVRQYGNMMRAGDCPGDLLANRARTANLRLTSGKTAVHADMLEWNVADTPENAARFVLSAMFSTIQYSVMLRTLPVDHKRMVAHWLDFSRRHRHALLKGWFRPHHYEANYPWIEAGDDTETVIGCYQSGTVLPVPSDGKAVYVLDGTGTGELVLDLAAPMSVRLTDTFGTPSGEAKLARGLQRVRLPRSGYLVLEGTDGSCETWNEGWTFRREGGQEEAVDLPHDAAIGFAFDPTRFSTGCGALPYAGRVDYAKPLVVTPEACAALASGTAVWWLAFDGVMSHAKVFVNGVLKAERPNGYASFRVPLDNLVAGTNDVRVVVDAPPESSRWYPGLGIYRDVRLVRAPADHVIPGSVAIVTESVTPERACLRATWEMSVSGPQELRFDVPKPQLWSPETPKLYSVELGGETFRYGIRTLRFSPTEGFFLNGVHRQMRGVCLHHDLGVFGAAFVRDAARRQLALLKEMGCDAIRTSHNFPAPGLLDLCDEMGFLVMDEAFDEWKSPKVKHGMAEVWDDWHVREVVDFVRRDRNHPCVVMWSAGNELGEDEPKRDLCGQGVAIARELTALFHANDPEGRPVTAGHWQPSTVTNGIGAATDVFGANYLPSTYASFRGRQGVIGTETCSTVSTRGTFVFPVDDKLAVTNLVSDYGLCTMWPNDYPPDVEFAAQEANPHVYGEFVWTGFDYLGEPDPWRKTSRSSYFGIFDLCGFPKSRYWLYKSQWRPDVPLVHIVPHWNWKSGDHIPVHVFTSGDAVELILNGRSLGVRRKERGVYRLVWDAVPWEPGELVAIATKGGRPWARDVRETTGPFARLAFSDESYGPYIFRTVRAVDAEGREVPTAAVSVTAEPPDGYRLVGTCNGDPADLQSLRSPTVKTFNGRALIVYCNEKTP